MPITSPVHEPMLSRCNSMRFKEWAGYFAVCSFLPNHEREYFAIRHGAGLIDVSPLFKYSVIGIDASAFLSRVMVKDITKLKPGQVTYCCWCDEQGKVIDDGTVAKISDDEFRVTAAEPSLSWFSRYSRGYSVAIQDVTADFAALSLQGPNSKATLNELTGGSSDSLKFFRFYDTLIAGKKVTLSRTGYTGDLGYEVWADAADGANVYEAILAAGADFGVKPVGLDAMDVSRIEAGFIMNGVDYFSAHHCLAEHRKSTPYELNLGWCVNLNRDFFNGQAALIKENAEGPKKKFIGLDVDWVELENLFDRYDLPPEVCTHPWRDGRPLYDEEGEFIGQATSGTWSPTLKKNIALASVQAEYAKVGTKLKIEVTVEYRREKVTATVTELPFFNPKRKRD